MSTVEADPQLADSAHEEPATDGPEQLPGGNAEPPAAGEAQVVTGPACRACGAPIGPGQDWCLECGTAVEPPRRLPGLRTLGLAGLLTLVLAGGAVAASYAALTDQKPQQETHIQTVATAAPAPPPQPATTAPADTTPADTTPAPSDTTSSGLSTGDSGTSTLNTVPPPPSTGSTDTGTTGTGTDSTGTDTTGTATTPPPPEFSRVVIAGGAGSLYDPAARATGSGDPQRALDGNFGTSWFATTPADGDMKVGYVINLGEPTQVKKLELYTKTPGFTVQIFGAKGDDPPGTAEDKAWTALGGAGSVDATPQKGAPPAVAPADGDEPDDGKVTLPFPDAGTKKFQQILVWFTVPPVVSPTVRLTELKLFGPGS